MRRSLDAGRLDCPLDQHGSPHGGMLIQTRDYIREIGGDPRDRPAPLRRARRLEAIIGLPAGLFYGTGIPACLLVLNKRDAPKRKHVVFINAYRGIRRRVGVSAAATRA